MYWNTETLREIGFNQYLVSYCHERVDEEYHLEIEKKMEDKRESKKTSKESQNMYLGI